MSEARVKASLQALADVALRTASQADAVSALAARYEATFRQGGTVFFAGNGGSAADAQHLATEYVVRYQRTRRALPAVALTTDSSLLTAAGNDLGFEHIFSRQVEALCGPEDLLVLHSTSGASPNLLMAAKTARAKGVPVVAMLGRDGGALADVVDDAIIVESTETSHIQEVQLALEHIIAGIVDEAVSAT